MMWLPSRITNVACLAVSLLVVGACGGSATPGGDGGTDANAQRDSTTAADGTTGADALGGDTGVAEDTGSGGDGASGDDAGPATDGGSTADTGSATDGGGDDAAASCAGMQCAGFPTTFVRGCTNDQSCVGELHQTDCCGSIRVMGVNHDQATIFCPAEYGTAGVGGCRRSYPNPPMCSSNTLTTDTGETTTDMSRVATHCVMDPGSSVGTCTSYVCGAPGGTPCPAERHIGSCG
jgi:hypothetical protein